MVGKHVEYGFLHQCGSLLGYNLHLNGIVAIIFVVIVADIQQLFSVVRHIDLLISLVMSLFSMFIWTSNAS